MLKTSILIGLISLTVPMQVLSQSIETDKKLGAKNAALVASQIGLYPDEQMTKYIASIGDRLVAELEKNPFKFEFHIADDPIPNAFALPGGYVYVTRGLLSIVTSEDELACVMGHEIIHVTQRHSIKQMRSSVLPNLLEVPGAIVGTVVDEDLGNLINAPINTSNTLLLSSYSRKYETESDKKGVALAAKAGYDPHAMKAILTRLSEAVELITNEKQRKSYFDDHPFTTDRVKNINKAISSLTWEEQADIAPSFPSPLQGIIFGHNPSKGLFKENIFLHPEMDFSITFPKDWELSNQPTTVGAVHPDRIGGVFLGLEDPSKSPEYYAKAFEKEIMKKHRQKPSISEPYIVNTHHGYLVTLEDRTGSEVMYIHTLWLQIDKKVFKLIGFGPRALENDLDKTANSLRKMSQEEKKSIDRFRVKIVKSKRGETLDDLSSRSGNIAESPIISVMNGIDGSEKINDERMIKVVIIEPFFQQ